MIITLKIKDMNCSICKAQNEDSAQFCRNCGSNLYPSLEPNTDSKTADILLVIFIIIAFVSSVVNLAIEKLDVDWYDGIFRYVRGGLWILQNLSLLLVAIAIKGKTLKIIGIIVISFVVINSIFNNVLFLIS